jgi:hypothetical protein
MHVVLFVIAEFLQILGHILMGLFQETIVCMAACISELMPVINGTGVVVVSREVYLGAVVLAEPLGTEKVDFEVCQGGLDVLLIQFDHSRNTTIYGTDQCNDSKYCPENDSADVEKVCHNVLSFYVQLYIKELVGILTKKWETFLKFPIFVYSVIGL